MIVRILGDKRNDYNGILVAQFEVEGKVVDELTYDIANWEADQPSGVISANSLMYFLPEPFQLRFDEDVEMDVEHARKAFNILAHNHWEQSTNI